MDLLGAPPAVPTPTGLTAVHAAFAYEGDAADVIRQLKFRDGRRLVTPLVDAAVRRLPRPPAGAVVTWVPTTAARRRQRGFDQAELVARALARRWGVPCEPTLRRRAGPPQTGRDAAHRATGPRLVARRRVPRSVVLVDDVCTTGATLARAAAALRAAGAVHVEARVLAHKA